ncbi:hypothetical protein [Spirosoma terrae]
MNFPVLTQDLLNRILADNGMNSVVEDHFREVVRDESGKQILTGPKVDQVEACLTQFFNECPDLNTNDVLEDISTGEESEIDEAYGHIKAYKPLKEALVAWFDELI